jgi:hypothetical protein
MPIKQEDPLDIEVGRRLRALRLEKRMVRETQGEPLNPTLQKTRKNEKGTNHIGADRLQQIAQTLDASVQSFQLDAASMKGADDNLSELIDIGSALRLLRAYARIRSPSLRRALTNLAEEMAAKSAAAP